MNKNEVDNLIQKFISNPESFTLFRGENQTNQGGLHFTTDKDWASKFGENILEGKLPKDSKIKLIKNSDFEEGFKANILSEQQLWDSIFEKGYDAIVGYDPMNSDMLDIIINPKHLELFKVLN